MENVQELEDMHEVEPRVELLSAEVLEKARAAFEHHEHWVAYNNTLLFVHEDDIRFFGSPEEAHEYADRLNDEGNYVKVEKIQSAFELLVKVEKEFAKINHNKNHGMEQENFEYLKKQLTNHMGFGDALYGQLQEKLTIGGQEFQLNASHNFGKDEMTAVLNFKRSEKEGSERYFFNSYVATLKKTEGDQSMFVYVNHTGDNITFKESCNLLNTRAVFQEIQPKDKEPYMGWVWINPDEIDQKTGYNKLRVFGENYGFDLAEAVGRQPFKELSDPEKLQTLYLSLQKGNLAPATLLKNGKELKVTICADPRLLTMRMYDSLGVRMYYPAMKEELKHQRKQERELNGAKQDGVGEKGVKKDKKVDLMPKKVQKNNLLPKKRVKKGKGQTIA